MNDIEKYSLCVKIILFLHKNKKLSKEELLYLISLSDFYKDGNMISKNIKNINSLKYYSDLISQALTVAFACDLLIMVGNELYLSATGNLLAENITDNEINSNLILKINYISSNYSGKYNLEKVYEELVNKFIINNVGGYYNEN